MAFKNSISVNSNLKAPAHSTLLLAGTLLLAAVGPAHAGGGWNEFRGPRMNDGKPNRHGFTRGDDGRGINRVNTDRRSVVSAVTLPVVSPQINVKPHHHRGARRDFADFRVNNQTLQLTAEGMLVNAKNDVRLDLGSDTRNITLGAKLFGDQASVVIETTGGSKTLAAGAQVTAAEYIAVKQALTTGRQDVVVDAQGKAIGGDVDLSAITSNHDSIRAESLLIPVNVTASGDFSKRSDFQLKGDLINAGSLYAISTKGGTTSGVIRADNITNEVGGSISSSISDLTLRADDTLSNFGSISSSGNLTLSAGKIVNKGTVQTTGSSITLDGLDTSALTIDNTGGVVSAANGAINIRNAAFAGAFDTTVNGGDFLSRELNVNSGQGTANLYVDKITGTLNQTGLASHVFANTDELSLGNICLTGDPTYSNSTGNISINGNITVGEALTLIASGNISNSTAVTITAGDGTTGYPITMIAGANIISGGTTGTVGPIPPVVAGTATTIDGNASATGGDITLGTAGAVTINTRSTATTGDHAGGNVFIAAFRNGSNVGGNVNLTGSTILTGGLGTGGNGNVTIWGGSIGGVDAIRTDIISTTGGSAVGTGRILIQNSQPTSSGGNIIYNADGTLGAGGTLLASNIAIGGGVTVNGNLTALSDIQIIGAHSGTVAIAPNVTIRSLSTGVDGLVFINGQSATTITAGAGSLIQAKTVAMSGAGGIGAAGAAVTTNAQDTEALAGTADVFLSSTNADVPFFVTTGDDVTITAVGTIMSTLSELIEGNTVTLTSTAGGIGLSNNNRAFMAANTLSLSAANKVLVRVGTPSGTTTLTGTMKAGGLFSLSGTGDLAMTAGSSITAARIGLSGSEFNTLAGTITASERLSLSSQQDITNAGITATINTPELFLSTLGSIGTSTASRFNTGATISRVSASADGDVFLTSDKTKGFQLLAGRSGLGTFDFLGVNSVTIAGNIQAFGAGQDLNIITAAGTITVGDSVNLISSGDLTLQVTDTVNPNKSNIKLLANSTLQTLAPAGSGDITISIGAVGPVVDNATPDFVQMAEVGTAGVFFGQFGFSSKKFPVRMLYADNGDIIFNNPVATKNIVLEPNVRIVADPPPGDSSSYTDIPNDPNYQNTVEDMLADLARQSRSGRVDKHNAKGPKQDFDFTSLQYLAANETVALSNGADFNLSSEVRNILLGEELFGNSETVTITTGGTARTLSVGSAVTAAEYLAAQQVLSGRDQALVLDSQGRATGGQVDLTAIGDGARIQADDLHISSNVVAYGNFGKRSNFTVGGDLVNEGSLFALSGRRSDGIVISAEKITNKEGALISSVRDNAPGDIGRRAASKIDLILNAGETISNSGSIESSGTLTLSAFDSVKNNGGAKVTADGSITILSSNLKNAGTIQSTSGNINIDSVNPSILAVNNTGGTMRALNGAINLRDFNLSNTYDTVLVGGDLFSEELNINAGEGVADVTANNLTGTVNVTGWASHVLASTDTMTLGKICLTGDPTFSNNNGNIVITGDVIVQESLAILASGDITDGPGFITIEAIEGGGGGGAGAGFASPGDGRNIVIIAGAAFQPPSGDTISNLGPPLPASQQAVLTGGPSATGGNVVLGSGGGGGFTLIHSDGQQDGARGGDVLIAAFASGGGLNGRIDLNGSTLSNHGRGIGATNGNTTIIAGGSDFGGVKAIRLGSIFSFVDITQSNGDVAIFNRQPTSPGIVTFDINGDMFGNINPGAAIPTAAGVEMANTVFASNISVAAGDGSSVVIPTIGIFAIGPTGTTIIDAPGTSSIVAAGPPLGSNHIFTLGALLTSGSGDIGTPANPIFLSSHYTSAVTSGAGDVGLRLSNTQINVLAISGDVVDIISQGSIMHNSLFGPIFAATSLNLNAATSIGITPNFTCLIDSPNVTLNSTFGDVLVQNLNAATTTLNGGTAGLGRFFYEATGAGGLTTPTGQTISAADIALVASGGPFGALNATLSASNSINLVTLGDLLTTPGNIDSTKLLTPNLSLLTTGSSTSIGNATDRFAIGDNVLSVSAVSPFGNVFLLADGTTGSKVPALGVSGSANDSITGTFDVLGGLRSITVDGSISTNGGDINIVTQRTEIKVDEGVALVSSNNILMQVTEVDPQFTKKTKIIVGKDATIETISPAGGLIDLVLGANGTPVAGTKPKNMAVAEIGASVLFGNGIATRKPTNFAVAKNANVEFSSPVSSRNISLEGGVVIFADPPAPGEATAATMSASSAFAAPNTLETGILNSFSSVSSSSSAATSTLPSVVQQSFTTDAAQVSTAQPAIQMSDLNSQLASINSQFANINSSSLTLMETLSAKPVQLTATGNQDDSYITRNVYSDRVSAKLCAHTNLLSAVSSGTSTTTHVPLTEKMSLSDDDVLCVADKDTTIKSSCGTVRVKQGSVVLVSTRGDKLAVFNLDDRSHESVVVEVGGKRFSLNPGRHVMVTNEHRGDFADVNEVMAIAHRRLTSHSANGKRIYFSEFSIPTALNSIDALKRISSSKHKEAHKVVDHMFKTVAAVMHVSNTAEPYRHYVKPTITAIAH